MRELGDLVRAQAAAGKTFPLARILYVAIITRVATLQSNM